MYYLSDTFSSGDNDKFCCVIRRTDVFSYDSIFACKFWISSYCRCWTDSNIVDTFHHIERANSTLTFYEFVTRIHRIKCWFTLVICLWMRKYSTYFVSYMLSSLYDSMVEGESVRARDDEMLSVFFESFPWLIYRASIRIWDGNYSYTITFDNWIYNLWIWRNEYRCRMWKYLTASLVSVTAGWSENKNRWLHKHYNKNIARFPR